MAKKKAKSNKRMQDIVFLNIVFCLLVIFIHTASEVVSEMPTNTSFFKVVFSAHRLSSFVVQGFLLLSAVKLFLKTEINYPKYYLGRFFRVVVPYVIWVFIYYCYFVYKGYFGFSVVDFLGYIVRGDLSAHFYYIIILVQFYILAPVWRLLYRKGNTAVHIAFSLIITIITSQCLMTVLTTLLPSIPRIDFARCFLKYLVYWTAGCLIGKNYNEFRSYLKSNVISISITFVICGFLNVVLGLATFKYEPAWLDIIHTMYCMSAILFFYMIGQLFNDNSILKPLTFIDKSTYAIYLMHCLVLVICNDVMTVRGITSLVTRFGIRTAVVYGVSIGICILWQIVKVPIAKAIRKS